MAVESDSTASPRHAQCLLERGDIAVELCEPSAAMLDMAWVPETASSLLQWKADLRVHSSLEAMLAGAFHRVGPNCAT